MRHHKLSDNKANFNPPEIDSQDIKEQQDKLVVFPLLEVSRQFETVIGSMPEELPSHHIEQDPQVISTVALPVNAEDHLGDLHKLKEDLHRAKMCNLLKNAQILKLAAENKKLKEDATKHEEVGHNSLGKLELQKKRSSLRRRRKVIALNMVSMPSLYQDMAEDVDFTHTDSKLSSTDEMFLSFKNLPNKRDYKEYKKPVDTDWQISKIHLL